MAQKYNLESIGILNLFENVTKVRARDCFLNEESIVFIVGHGDISRAIGKDGANIKRLENMLNKKIKVVEFNEKPLIFVSNLVYPLKPDEISIKENIIEIRANDVRTKGLLIGREKKNLKRFQEIFSRYFGGYEIKVV